MSRKIVIIGAVAAGPKVAARARRLDPEAEIIMVERGRRISYAGCGMPFYLSGVVREFKELFLTSYGITRDEEYFLSERNIKVLTGTEALRIDRTRKVVWLRNIDTGEEYPQSYDKLVLATGSVPFNPPLPGLDLKGVHRLNHPDEALTLKEALDQGPDSVVVLGAGMIGMEVAEALVERKMFVTVVELQPQVLPGMLDPDMAQLLQNRLEEIGWEFHTGTRVLRLEGDEEGKVRAVVTDRGTIEADLVIAALGVRPNVELAKSAGLTIGETGAIAVNEFMQTSDPDIYALGDCAEAMHLISGRRVYLPMATYAARQGRVVGDNVAGGQSRFKGVLGTAILKVVSLTVARTGLGEMQARNLGYDVETSLMAGFDRTHYHPKHAPMVIKLIVDKKSRRVLGAQGIGPGEVNKRIDVIATALNFGATVDDLADLDLAYAPPYSTPLDPVHNSANLTRNILAGLANTIKPAELKAKLDNPNDDSFVIIDVRTLPQFSASHLDDPRVRCIPLGELRRRLDEIPRDKEIITMCAVGVRSYEAQRILTGAGFTNVRFLEGGTRAWPYEL